MTARALNRRYVFVSRKRIARAHFVAVIAGDAPYEPPTDQIVLHKIVEAIYKSADEGREIRL